MQRRQIVREALREVGERRELIGAPPQPAVDARQLLEHLRLAAHLGGEPAKRVHGLGEPVLLGVVEDGHQARSPQRRVARQGAFA